MRASQPALSLKRYQICQNTVTSYCILFALNTLISSLLFLQVLYVAISTMFFHVVKNCSRSTTFRIHVRLSHLN